MKKHAVISLLFLIISSATWAQSKKEGLKRIAGVDYGDMTIVLSLDALESFEIESLEGLSELTNLHELSKLSSLSQLSELSALSVLGDFGQGEDFHIDLDGLDIDLDLDHFMYDVHEIIHEALDLEVKDKLKTKVKVKDKRKEK